MADTNLPVTPGSGTNVDGYSLTNGNFRQTMIVGDPSDPTKVAPVDAVKGLSVDIAGIGANALGQEVSAASIPVVIASDQSSISVIEITSNLGVSATGVSGAAVTATLPAVAGQFHYLTFIEITRYAVAAITGTATPVVVTTTNLPGSLAFTFDTAGAIGTSIDRISSPTSPIKASASNTATTIVCPATTSVIWRVNVFYYTAA